MKQLMRLLLLLFLAIGLVACSSDDANVPNENDQNNNEDVENTENENHTDDEDPESNSNENASDHSNNGNDGDGSSESGFAFAEHERDNADGEIESGKGGYLWKVENEGTTVYLQGTVHIGTEDFYPFHDSIEEAYEESDIVVPEVDIVDVDILSSLGATVMHGVYIDGSSLEDHISSDVYDQLEDVLDDYGLPIDIMKYFKPWMISTTINQLVAEELGYMQGVDMYFLERAEEDEKEIIELESVSDQYDILSGQSDEFQERELKETLDGMDQFEDSMEEVFSLYLDGDIDALLSSLFPEDESEMDEEYREYLKVLNDDRNEEMTEKIEEFLEEDEDQTYFVIVGTAHLIKDPHILMMLDEKGYTVEHVY